MSTAPRDDAERPLGTRLGPLGWLRWTWRTLTSMRTALILLLLLSLAAIPGSLVPQDSGQPSEAAAFRADHPTLTPVYEKLGLFDVYASPWFAAVYLLLFLSLGGCILPRCLQFARTLRARPPTPPRRLDRMPEHTRWTSPTSPDEALEAARRALRRRRFRLRMEKAGAGGSGGAVSGEKGYLREAGNLLFHLALFGLLVALAVGGLFGSTGQVLVVEGDSFTNARTQYDDFQPAKLDSSDELPAFSFRLEEFTGKYQLSGPQRGTPTFFQARVRASKTVGGPEREVTIRVNDPMEVGGSKVYLVGHGYAPVVTVRDGKGDVAWSGPVPFLPQDAFVRSTGVVKVPDARDHDGKPTQLGFTGLFLPTVNLSADGWSSVYPGAANPALVLTAYHGDLGMESDFGQSVYQLDTSRMTQFTKKDGSPFAKGLRPGDKMTLPDGAGSLTFDGLKEWASFQVATNPSNGTALWSSIAAGLGLTASLFIRRRRLWIRIRPASGSGSQIEVAGLERTASAQLAKEVAHLTAELRRALPPTDSATPQPQYQEHP
ncbi:cytochrome c biogenesis protein ResB [Streptomyces gobiensis]|uniref:cytochrome c biogenesis protein ResB n=1 Tax=Streptomyces gobiensis TaxID=2875706 RepID=UPI001E6033F4|nr:cytochrome c biogenesis protein ResB [Streptomyces gobiensis]UGY91301.1 cytochrome c biogenesis protein ResB [Streptomyces gobiensis]